MTVTPKDSFNKESYETRVGTIIGKLMGKYIHDADFATNAMKALAGGDYQAFLKMVPEAVRVRVAKILPQNGKPFALDARELAEREESNKKIAKTAQDVYNSASKGKKPEAKAAAPEVRPPKPKSAHGLHA